MQLLTLYNLQETESIFLYKWAVANFGFIFFSMLALQEEITLQEIYNRVRKPNGMKWNLSCKIAEVCKLTKATMTLLYANDPI